MCPIQQMTPKMGGSFTSTSDPTSSSFSSHASSLSGGVLCPFGDNNREEVKLWMPLACGDWSATLVDVGVRGFGGGRGGGRGGKGLWVGFGGGSGGGFTTCFPGGIRATLEL